MEWNFFNPVKIVFGQNKVFDLLKICQQNNYKRVLLICDPIFIKNNLAVEIKNSLSGLSVEIFCDITPNPTTDEVDKCSQIIKENNIDVIVALGGGSSIDCGKAAASICMESCSITEYMGTGKKFQNKALPIIAVPTTAGTGSEVTNVSVLSNEKLKIKMPVGSDNFYPKFAIVDPVLTATMPKSVTASTGMDVLAHAIEGYWSKNHQPICDALAVHAARIVFDCLPVVFEEPNNISGREKMCEASVIAGFAFSNPKTAASHACSFALTSDYGVPHGEACAMTLDIFTRINAKAENNRMENFSRLIGFKDCDEMAEKIYQMKKYFGFRTTLKELGAADDESITKLAKKSQNANMKNNPVLITEEKMIELYRSIR